MMTSYLLLLFIDEIGGTMRQREVTRKKNAMTVNLKIKRIIFFFTHLILILFFGACPNVFCQNPGFKHIENYNAKDHFLLYRPRSILQGKRGVIYALCSGGLLDFDGVSWRRINTPLKTRGRLKVAVDHYGTIFVGGVKEIGYIAPDSKGELQYVPLSDHLDDNLKNFLYVRKAHSTKEGIYFETFNYLFRWDNQKIKAWKWDIVLRKTFNKTFSCRGKLFIYKSDIGLMHIVHDSFAVAPGGEAFAKKHIVTIVPYDSKRLLIGTMFNGFYLYDGIKAEPFPTDVDDYLRKNPQCCFIRLSTGDFALTTRDEGLVIMDANGRIKEIFSINHGLQDNSVTNVFEDFQSNLWVGLRSGISKIEYNSPFTIYDNRSLFSGEVRAIIKHHNVLYVGTNQGLYYLDPPGSFTSPGKFHPVPAVSRSCSSMLLVGDSLLVTTIRDFFQVGPGNSINRLDIQGNLQLVMQSKKDKNRIWARTGDDGKLVSLYLNKKNGKWVIENEFENITQKISRIFEDKKGNLWLTDIKKLLKVDFPIPGTINNPVVTQYDLSKELSIKSFFVYMAADHVIFSTEKGIFRFDEDNKVFIPDFTLGDEFAGGEKVNLIFHIVEDKNKNIWFLSMRGLHQAIHQPDGSYVIHSKFIRHVTNVYNIYPDEDGYSLWFVGMVDLVHYDTRIKGNDDINFSALVRQVLANGNLVYGGHKIDIDNDAKSTGFVPLAYNDRNLRFEFAAPFFEDEWRKKYQYFLEGYDRDWSDWTSETRKEYTNLEPALYTFRVRAKNVYQRLGREDVFQFKILLPWYRTWWAFLLYAAVIFMLVFFIVKWRHSLQLEKEKQRLEQTVKDRTMELKEKNRQLKEQAEKLEEMDKVKSRFFANISHEFRTPLTLIMGPLEQMLSKSQDKEQHKKLNLMLRNSQRLFTLINQLLELSKFDSGKVKLQAGRQNIIPFLKGIIASFEPVVNKNQLDLTFHAEEDNMTLYFDPEKLEQVILNLLSNAVKFTPAGGKIMVTVSKSAIGEENFLPGSLNISVSDTGPGIFRDQLAHIFNRFYQSDNTYEHNHKGSGIGLAIAKEIVELHHGRIEVHSHEGKGTEFIIQLPSGDAHLEPDEMVEPLEEEYKHKDPVEFDEIESEAALEKNGKNIILVVEDSTDIREYIRDSLEPLYTVVGAANGKEGRQKAQEIIPDLIICDIMMPAPNGYELCRLLKNDISTSHIPIILLTAKASEESIIQGLESGADDYIIKPFNTKVLCTRIQNLIDLRSHLQQTLKREMTLQPTKISMSRNDKKFIKKLKEVIDKNISDPDFNVAQMCKELDMSQSTLYRKIYALSGEAPTAFIRSYRLKRGAELLKENFGTVLEVALEVGFSSANYFSKCFKKMFHQLPSTYQTSEAD